MANFFHLPTELSFGNKTLYFEDHQDKMFVYHSTLTGY